MPGVSGSSGTCGFGPSLTVTFDYDTNDTPRRTSCSPNCAVKRSPQSSTISRTCKLPEEIPCCVMCLPPPCPPEFSAPTRTCPTSCCGGRCPTPAAAPPSTILPIQIHGCTQHVCCASYQTSPGGC